MLRTVGMEVNLKPSSLLDFIDVVKNASPEWIEENIHPNVPRKMDDNDDSYLRRMALWARATNTFHGKAEDTNAKD